MNTHPDNNSLHTPSPQVTLPLNLTWMVAGNTNLGERLSTVDLLVKVTKVHFVKKNANTMFNINTSWYKLVRTRRSKLLLSYRKTIFQKNLKPKT
jgi:hypothetical protein